MGQSVLKGHLLVIYLRIASTSFLLPVLSDNGLQLGNNIYLLMNSCLLDDLRNLLTGDLKVKKGTQVQR